MITVAIFLLYALFVIGFGAFSWYFTRRIIEMRFENDKSFLAVRIYSVAIGIILFITLLLLLINNIL